MSCITGSTRLRSRSRSALRLNAQGTARPFLMGFENPIILPSESFQMQAFTEQSGIPLEKTDNTSITLPSDTDGFTLTEVTTGYGGEQALTFTLTEYMDERQNAPYLAGVRRDLPFALWVPEGRGRQLSDPHDFTSGTLVSLATIGSLTRDDASNPSDGDVGNPNKISATGNSHGRHVHKIQQASFTAPSGVSLASGITGVATLGGRHDLGAKTRRWFMIEDSPGTATGQAKIHWTDTFGNWSSYAFGDFIVTAQAYRYRKCIVTGGYVITLLSLESTDAGITPADPKNGHYVFPVATLGTAAPTLVVRPTKSDGTGWGVGVDFSGWADETRPQNVFALSPTQIFFVGGLNREAGVGGITAGIARIFCSNGPLSTPSQVDVDGPAASCYYAVHGRDNQLVVGGGTGSSAATASPLIKVSDDFGATWTTAANPTGMAGAVTAAYMISKDAFWVGTAAGDLRFTYDFGKTWHPGNNKDTAIASAGLLSINDIAFVEREGSLRSEFAGYITGTTAARGAMGVLRIVRTLDGGSSWHAAGSYIEKQPASTSHANTIWGDLVVADTQTVLAGGGSGGTGRYTSATVAMMDNY